MKTDTVAAMKGAGQRNAPSSVRRQRAPSEEVPPAPVLPAPKRRRRPVLLAAGVVLVVLGALGAYAVASATSHRISVVALAADVAWGQAITSTDLVEAQIVTDPAVHPLAWSERTSAVGQMAGTDLHAGALLMRRDIASAQIPAEGQALVGVTVKASQLPATELAPRQQVWIIRTGQGGRSVDADGPADPIQATVFMVGAPDTSGGRTIDVLVTDTDAAPVAEWSAAGVAAIIVVPGR